MPTVVHAQCMYVLLHACHVAFSPPTEVLAILAMVARLVEVHAVQAYSNPLRRATSLPPLVLKPAQISPGYIHPRKMP